MRSHVVSIASRCKWIVIALVASGALLASRPAAAQACVNDIDCPEPACGGQVCDWNMGMTCQPAGRMPAGSDGWCTTTDDCKCKGMGAVCTNLFCSFTKPPTGSGGSTGSGGTTGAGGTSGGTPSDGGGCSVVGSPGPAPAALLLGLVVALVRRRRK
jgi:MYXO-CTERM domain-containing protein